jgi:single-strand DNA-binding protein
MASLNRVFLMGNLTRDVELRHTNSQQAVATIGLAVNRRWRTPDGEDREETTFVDCEAWGRTAETMSKYLAKGRPVFIEGRLKLDQWEKEGQKFSKLKVVIENFQFIDSRQGGEGGGGGGGGGGGYRSAGSGGGGGGGSGGGGGGGRSQGAGRGSSSQPSHEDVGDDIPF